MEKLKSKISNTISIHAPRVGGDEDSILWREMQGISIHAPRVGGDHIQKDEDEEFLISIHAPRVGGDRTAFSACPDRR